MNDFITKGIFSKEQFSALKKELQNDIKANLKVKRMVLSNSEDTTSLEYFAIAIMNPKYND